MPSSVIRHYKYDPKRHALLVTFRSGKVYVYADVPPDVFAEFNTARSKGQYFNLRIRDEYDYAEVTDLVADS